MAIGLRLGLGVTRDRLSGILGPFISFSSLQPVTGLSEVGDSVADLRVSNLPSGVTITDWALTDDYNGAFAIDANTGAVTVADPAELLCPIEIAFVSPQPGDTLVGATQEIYWTAMHADESRIKVGSTPGGSEYHTGAATTSEVHNALSLPEDGSAVYITIESRRTGGEWVSIGGSFVAHTAPTMNMPPVTNQDGPISVDHNTASALIDVLANDTDEDGDTLSVVSINGATWNGSRDPIAVANGVVAINVSDELTFTPTNGFSGQASFFYGVSDGVNPDVSGSVVLQVEAPVPNNPPVLVDDGPYDIIHNDTGFDFDPLGNDSDPDGDNLTVTRINSVPLLPGETVAVASGTVTLLLPENSGGALNRLRFIPTVGFVGTATFDYYASDGTDTRWATTTINVAAPAASPNSAPVTTNDGPFDVPFNSPGFVTNVLANDTDADGDPLVVDWINSIPLGVGETLGVNTGDGQGVNNGTITRNADGTLTFVPVTGFSGYTDIGYHVFDGIVRTQGICSWNVAAAAPGPAPAPTPAPGPAPAPAATTAADFDAFMTALLPGAPYSLGDLDLNRLVGSGKTDMDVVSNRVIGGPQGIDASYRVRIAKGGILQSMRTMYEHYLPGGYGKGTGGVIRCRCVNDVNGSPGTTVYDEHIRTPAISNGKPTDIPSGSVYFFNHIFSGGAQLATGQIVHFLFENIDADPVNNFISINASLSYQPPPSLFYAPTDFGVYTKPNIHGQDQWGPFASSGIFLTPVAQINTSGGSFGNSNYGPSNFGADYSQDYPFSFSNGDPIRTKIYPASTKIYRGGAIALQATTGGALDWQLTTAGGSVLASGSFSRPSSFASKIYTSGTEWIYDANEWYPFYFGASGVTLSAGTTYYLTYRPRGSSIWRSFANEDGRSAGFSIAPTELTGQIERGSTWGGAVPYNHNDPSETGTWREILVTN